MGIFIQSYLLHQKYVHFKLYLAPHKAKSIENHNKKKKGKQKKGLMYTYTWYIFDKNYFSPFKGREK